MRKFAVNFGELISFLSMTEEYSLILLVILSEEIHRGGLLCEAVQLSDSRRNLQEHRVGQEKPRTKLSALVEQVRRA